jgi:serine/threonine protein phosphatase 1
MIEGPRVVAIGDIHGSAAALDALLGLVAPTPDDVVITLGDYVDRGIDSAGVIERLIRLSGLCRLIPLRGNHEEMMMDSRRGREPLDLWKELGGDATLISYSPEEGAPDLERVPAHHWHFLDHICRDLYEMESHVFVHGGLDPSLPLDRQPPAVLRWQTFPPPRPHPCGKVVICGHTPQRSGVPATLPHAICIDTKAYDNGWLTCLDVTNGSFWQANEHGETREAVLRAPKRRW